MSKKWTYFFAVDVCVDFKRGLKVFSPAGNLSGSRAERQIVYISRGSKNSSYRIDLGVFSNPPSKCTQLWPFESSRVRIRSLIEFCLIKTATPVPPAQNSMYVSNEDVKYFWSQEEKGVYEGECPRVA